MRQWNRAWAAGAALAAVGTGLLAQSVPPAVKAAEATIDAEKIRAHVRFLADDLLEGRGRDFAGRTWRRSTSQRSLRWQG